MSPSPALWSTGLYTLQAGHFFRVMCCCKRDAPLIPSPTKRTFAGLRIGILPNREYRTLRGHLLTHALIFVKSEKQYSSLHRPDAKAAGSHRKHPGALPLGILPIPLCESRPRREAFFVHRALFLASRDMIRPTIDRHKRQDRWLGVKAFSFCLSPIYCRRRRSTKNPQKCASEQFDLRHPRKLPRHPNLLASSPPICSHRFAFMF